MARVPSSSHPKPRIDWLWIGFVIIETIVNVGLLRFRWFSLSWAQLGWAFAELVRFFSTLFKAFQLLMPIKRAPLNLDKLLDRKDFPTVDIMIPCYNEPLEIVEETTRAALALDYPQEKVKVYVLDDGKSQEVAQMVARLGSELGHERVSYIARKKTPGVPHHAKAGNLNHAIFEAGTKGDFIVVFDSDMVALPSFLLRILGYFYRQKKGSPRHERDPTMSLVMSPQDFYNVPANDPMDERETMTYDRNLMGWDGHGCAPCFGTNVVFSREALIKVKGFAYGSVTEDFFTSMQLHAAGYNSAYCHEHLAFGLVPTDLNGYFTQRERWTTGGLQVFKVDNPFFKKGLNWRHRMIYGWHSFSAVTSVIGNIYQLLLPLFFLHNPSLVCGERGRPQDLVLLHLAFTLVTLTSTMYNGWDVGAAAVARHLRLQLFMCFSYLRSILTVALGIKFEFLVTRKDGKGSELSANLSHIAPHLTYFFVALTAVSRIAFLYFKDPIQVEPLLSTHVALPFAILILAMNLWALWPPIQFAVYTPPPATFTAFAKEMGLLEDKKTR